MMVTRTMRAKMSKTLVDKNGVSVTQFAGPAHLEDRRCLQLNDRHGRYVTLTKDDVPIVAEALLDWLCIDVNVLKSWQWAYHDEPTSGFDLERILELDMRTQGDEPPVFDRDKKRYEGWIVCPRAHAIAHCRRVLDPSASRMYARLIQIARNVYGPLHRFHEGDDLVFAVADIQ